MNGKIPTPKIPTKKDSTKVNLMSGISSGQAQAKMTGIKPALPKSK